MLYANKQNKPQMKLPAVNDDAYKSSNDEINEKSAETQIPTSQISSRKVGIPNSKTMVYNSVD